MLALYDAGCKPSFMFSQHTIILSKNIAAMAVEAAEGGKPQYGPLGQLPRGTQVTVVGDGFNDRTVRVQCNDRLYFVFLQDIEEPDSSYYLS
jgi:hypothetical protein